MTPDVKELPRLVGREVKGPDGDKIGKIDDIYLDEQSGRPEWIAVTTGWFGTRQSFVPLRDAEMRDDEFCIPYDKDLVKDAPNAEKDGYLSPEEEERLYRHYDMADTGHDAGNGHGDRQGKGKGTGTAGSGDDAMTRSEEELQVGTRKEDAGRVRLRKWVDTEHVQEKVPVTRETARVEREPVDDGNIDQAMSGPEISEGEHTEVLHEERAVSDKKVVPKERVRVEKDKVKDEETVEADLRKERVDVDEDAAPKKGRK